jgi:uncharacterized protein YbbC (DUF1343 family)
MKLGIEVFLEDKKMLKALKGRRVSLVCHPASVNQKLEHSFDLLHQKLKLSSAFGPQHGVKGEKQDNMVESKDELHQEYQIPIYSLYGEVRRPTEKMMKSFDVLIFDLQDLGCRIYTFITTLLYMMEECAKYKKTLIVLDRPNPAGRNVEGFRLEKGFESFVGAAPIPMRHGLTLAELAIYYKSHFSIDLDLRIVKMKGYQTKDPWPKTLSWINPSPNAPNLNMARAYSGSVLLEGTTLSEGRGTTRSLEVAGAPDLDFKKILLQMRTMAPQWMKGAIVRECYFEPTFHKHQGKTCHGFQVHTDHPSYQAQNFRPFRLFVLLLKIIKLQNSAYPLFRDFAYEYVTDKVAFDVINGGPKLRRWIEDDKATVKDLERLLNIDEKSWQKEAKAYYLYK